MKRTALGILLLCVAAPASADPTADRQAASCPMTSLTGEWQLEYIVTDPRGRQCASTETWLKTWLGGGTGDVDGFFVPVHHYGYDPCCYVLRAEFDEQCNFTWTLRSSGVRSITVTLVSPTELRGRAHMSVSSSDPGCDAIVTVIKR